MARGSRNNQPSCIERLGTRLLTGALLVVVLGGFCAAQSGTSVPASKAGTEKPVALPEGSWRFVVSGDSRNCGDVVMPTIAAHSRKFSPSFYWHLGDLRAIYKIDEDMAAAAQHNGEGLSCDTYQRRAWDDFVENQIAPFGDVPFYVGIGNHEVIPPKNEEAFRRHFFDWLNLPALQRQRQLDGEPMLPESYYHWIQGGVDFIYLDNAMNFFSNDELTWLGRRLQGARSNPEVKGVVVGMHEALPDSLANSHSLGDIPDEPRARPTGEAFYRILLSFHVKSKKPLYVLASHSHFYMEDIFNTDKLKEGGATPLPGWIVGTAGAVRYALPKEHPPTAKQDVYGYLLGTVSPDGKVQFSYQEVHESDVPQYVQGRYPAKLIPWCFEHNSQNIDPPAPDPLVCPAPRTAATGHP